jgi:uncharacterized membrane protein YphA (DoxX/SURF4 family)
MDSMARLGRPLFVAAIIAFGLMHCFYAITIKAPAPGPPWIPGGRVWAAVMAVFLIAAGATIATKARARLAAGLLALVMLLLVLLHYVPALVANVRNPGPWTSGFELLAMCGAALILADAAAVEGADLSASAGMANSALQVGRFVFAVSLVVFSIQHMLYAGFIATLVPAWVPGKLFWAYFVGVAFFAAALAIITGIQRRLAGTLLWAMFFLWVLLVHLPRIVGAVHNGNEWTSGLVALAMSGGALIVGSSRLGSAAARASP